VLDVRDLGDLRAAQRRIVPVLAVSQAAGGIGFGAAVSVGALLALDLSGSAAWSGIASTCTTLGAAAAAVPLARLAIGRGRRRALSTGWLVAALGASLAVLAAVVRSFPLLIVAMALLGVGNASNLQARFAATDLADPGARARSLGLVVWATTVGAVAGPNLTRPGAGLAGAVGVPALAGPLLVTAVASLVAAGVLAVALRPDPLLTARAVSAAAPAGAPVADRRGALALIAASPPAFAGLAGLVTGHAVMVGVMSLTPVHLHAGGASLTLIGLSISLHIAGMYALSPVAGWLADTRGRRVGLWTGYALLATAALLTAGAGHSAAVVTLGLIVLGLGWSFTTIAASAQISDAVAVPDRPRVQGTADLCMSLSGAVGGAMAGVLVSVAGYHGLSLVAALAVFPAAAILMRARPAPAPA
jgi:MFS family permease